MSLHSPILSTAIREYIVENSVREHPVQKKIRDENINHPQAHIQISPEQAQLLDPSDKSKITKTVKRLNEKLGKDDRIDINIIPIGDGMSLAMKK